MNQNCVPIKLYSQKKTKQAWRLQLAHFNFSTPWLCCLIKVSLSLAKTKTEMDAMEQWFWQRNPCGTLWNGAWSYKIWSFPSWISVLLWSNFSSLCLHPSFFEWYHIFCTKIYQKYVIYFIWQGVTLREGLEFQKILWTLKLLRLWRLWGLLKSWVHFSCHLQRTLSVWLYLHSRQSLPQCHPTVWKGAL